MPPWEIQNFIAAQQTERLEIIWRGLDQFSCDFYGIMNFFLLNWVILVASEIKLASIFEYVGSKIKNALL